MYVAELSFTIISQTSYSQAEAAIRNYLESLIFNGQLLGREFPTFLQQDRFISRLIVPATDALSSQHHSQRAKTALLQLSKAGLAFPTLTMLGEDLMSNHTDPCAAPDSFIFYTRFGLSNSLLYCAEHFAPVPLYLIPPTHTADHEHLIRWQLQFQALDEIQMQQQRVLDKTPEQSLQSIQSKLNRQGRKLAAAISNQLKKPVYYALYSGSSANCQTEPEKCCPGCGQPWRLAEPLHDLFDFQCHACKLVSNIAWQCQG